MQGHRSIPMIRPIRVVLIALMILSLVIVRSVALAQTITDVLTHHNDNVRSGVYATESRLTPAAISQGGFGLLYQNVLNGTIKAQPLYKSSVSIPGKGLRNVLFVATNQNRVYALDADASSNPFWTANLNTASPTATPIPQSDITPALGSDLTGVTSTPVIDPDTDTIYLIAGTKEGPSGSPRYVNRLHALDIHTGAEKFGGPVEINATVQGIGDNSSGNMVTLNHKYERPRAGMLLSKGIVYCGWASYIDIRPYHGWLTGFDAKTLKMVSVLNTTPNGWGGGIWMAGGGPAADENGNIFLAVGNGTVEPTTGPDVSMSVLKLTPGVDSSGSPNLSITDFFVPFNVDSLNAHDWDFGSSGCLLLPDQPGPYKHLVFMAGKDGYAYLLNRDDLGGYNAGSNRIVQAKPIAGGTAEYCYSSPVYFNGNLYFQFDNQPMKSYPVINGLIGDPTSQTDKSCTLPGATATISANGTRDAVLWMADANSQSLLAYDATDLSKKLYDSGPSHGKSSRWVPPVVANGKVYTVVSNIVKVSGLVSPKPTFTPAPGAYTDSVSVTIADSNPNAVIRYTTDGTTPTVNSPIYTTPLVITSPTTVNAIAYVSGLPASAVATGAYNVTSTIATPVIDPVGGEFVNSVSVNITDNTPGVSIYYTTDGSTPSASSLLYKGPFTLTSNTIVKAIAVKPGSNNSDIASANFTIVLGQTPEPVIDPDGGAFVNSVTVSISAPLSGSVIYYTLDGTPPNAQSTVYTTPLVLTNNVQINAIAIAPGYSASKQKTANYVVAKQCAAPVITPNAGSYFDHVDVTIACDTQGASIYYTLDGTAPTTASTLYTGPFTLNGSATVTAIAAKPGYENSTTVTVDFGVVPLEQADINLSPAVIAAGAKTTATLKLNSTAQSDIVVHVETDNPAVAEPMVTSVTIPAGATSASFEVASKTVATTTVVNTIATVGGATKKAPLTVTPIVPVSLSLARTWVFGGESTTATIVLNSATPSDLLVTLSSDKSAAAPASATLTIPAGSSGGTFAVNTVPVRSSTTAQISATANGATATAPLVVNTPGLNSISVSPVSVRGGTAAIGTVTLTGAPVANMTIMLGSDQSFATVPTSVIVPAGQSTATFTINTRSVSSSSKAMISAKLGPTTKKATLAVTGVYPVSIAFTPTYVYGGDGATGLVTLNDVSPSDLVVSISSDNPSVAAPVTGTITVPAGSATGTFRVTSVPVKSSTSAIFAASANGSSAQATLRVLTPGLVSLSLSPSTVLGGVTSTGTVTLTGIAAANMTIKLASSNASATVPASVVIPAGQSSVTFVISTSKVAAPTVAQISSTLGPVTKSTNLTINPIGPATVTFNPPAVDGGNVSTGTVSLNSVTPTDLVLTLTSDKPGVATPVNGTITVPAGSSSATFSVKTFPVAVGVKVNISATANGLTSSGTLTVWTPGLYTIRLSPATVRGGTSVIGTVLVTSVCAVDTVITLSSSNGAAIVPASVTIPAGSTSAMFPVNTIAVNSTTKVDIAAKLGSNSKSITLTLTP